MAYDDETTALLPSNPDADGLERSTSKDADPDLVDFNASYDPGNPLDFGRSYKWTVTLLLALMAFTTTFTCVGVVPVADRIVRDLDPEHRTDKEASVLLVTIWELGEAAGPLLIGPLSEIYGRYFVVNVANLGFVGAAILAALCQNSKLFIAARALNGLSVASNVLSPSIVGDIFITEQRGSAMSIVMLAPMLGGAVGPAIAGALAETFGWRAILWLSTLLMSACCLMFLLIFRETYKVVILRRRAAHMRSTTDNPRLHTAYDADVTTLGASILRPFSVYFYSPVLIAISLYASTTFTFFYILSTTMPTLLMDVYDLTPAQTGSTFMLFSLGSLFGVILCNLTLDRIYIYLRDRPLRHQQQHHITDTPIPTSPPPIPQSKPEHRLPLALLGALTLPITITLYGIFPNPPPSLSPQPFPLSYLLTMLPFLGIFLLLSFLPVLSYIVDATGRFSASAMTAVIVVRCLFGTFGPLAVTPLVRRFGWCESMIGIAVVVLAMGVIPALVLWKGADWRSQCRFMSGDSDAERKVGRKPQAAV